jgi:hypothetical protein
MNVPLNTTRARRNRIRKILAACVGAGVLVIGFFSSVATDTIRLGSSTYALPADAFEVRVTVVWLTAMDSNPEYDFYDIRIELWNSVYERDIRPSALELRVELPGALSFSAWPGGTVFRDQATPWDAPCDRQLDMTAGRISTISNPSGTHGGMLWRVEGEYGGRFAPLFERRAEFCLHQVRVVEGSGLHPNSEATLTWSHQNALQVYPVAAQTVRPEPTFVE